MASEFLWVLAAAGIAGLLFNWWRKLPKCPSCGCWLSRPSDFDPTIRSCLACHDRFRVE